MKKYNSRLKQTGLIYDHAIRFKHVTTYIPHKSKISKRGVITCFSRHSALRLRDALSSNTVPDSSTYGITLTVPWQSDEINFDSRLCRYHECFNRFCTSLRRALPNSASIFRHELQKRKMPHTHIVIWLSNIDKTSLNNTDLLCLIFSLWARAMQGNLYGGDMSHFYKFGVKIDPVCSNIAIMRYLCDHTSKSKQAQLGYIGKQWGYINRKLFISPSVDCFEMTPDQAIKISRALSRFSRFSLTKKSSSCFCSGTIHGFNFSRLHKMKRAAVFGSKKIPRHKLNSVVFLSRSTALKLFKFYNILTMPVDIDRPF